MTEARSARQLATTASNGEPSAAFNNAEFGVDLCPLFGRVQHMEAHRRQFGPGGYAARIVRATIRDTGLLIEQATEAGAKRLPDSGVTALDTWMRGHPNAAFLYGGIFGQNLETTERMLGACSDIAESIALLLDTNGRVLASPFVLERALGEAIMRLCYIFDHSAPPARTIGRMAAYQLESIEGNLRAAEAFGIQGAEKAVRARENIAEMHGWLNENGFELFADRREPFTVSLAIDGHRENIKFDATAAFKRYLPASAWQWELGSGVTHSRGWMLAGLLATSETEALTSPTEVAMAVAGSSLELGDALARAAHGHTGAEVTWYLAKNHQRRRGITSWSGMHQELAVDHTEYAKRGPNWKNREGHLGASFQRPPSASN